MTVSKQWSNEIRSRLLILLCFCFVPAGVLGQSSDLEVNQAKEQAEWERASQEFWSYASRYERADYLSRWRSVKVNELGLGIQSTCRADYSDVRSSQASIKKLKIGLPYLMIEKSSNPVIELLRKIASPSLSGNQRAVYAYNIKDISLNDWESVKDEVRRYNLLTERDVDFSFIIESDGQYIGVPIKWNKQSSEAISLAFEGVDKKSNGTLVTRLASASIDDSIGWISTLYGAEGEATQGSSSWSVSFDPCEYFKKVEESRELSKIFVGFSFQPKILGEVRATNVATESSLTRAPIGRVYPVWAEDDDQSPKAAVDRVEK